LDEPLETHESLDTIFVWDAKGARSELKLAVALSN
jgi:hypothetical protein